MPIQDELTHPNRRQVRNFACSKASCAGVFRRKNRELRAIRHPRIHFSAEQAAGSLCDRHEGPREHQYRGSRPWSVAALAAGSSLSAVLLTGCVSASLAGAFHATEAEPNLLAAMRTVAPEIRPALPAATMLEPASGWQIQIGSFRRNGAAEAQLLSLADTTGVPAKWTPHVMQFGSLERARISGFADEVEARGTCASIKERGLECIVVVPAQF